LYQPLFTPFLTQDNKFAVLKYIANGILGKKLFPGEQYDNSRAYFTLYYCNRLHHFFVLAISQMKALSKNKILTGILYGIFVWMIMNLVVVPLSSIGKRPFVFVSVLINVLILIVCIGIPLSFMANKFYKKQVARPWQKVFKQPIQ